MQQNDSLVNGYPKVALAHSSQPAAPAAAEAPPPPLAPAPATAAPAASKTPAGAGKVCAALTTVHADAKILRCTSRENRF